MRLSTDAVLRPRLQNLPLNRKPASIFEGGVINLPCLPVSPVCLCALALLPCLPKGPWSLGLPYENPNLPLFPVTRPQHQPWSRAFVPQATTSSRSTLKGTY